MEEGLGTVPKDETDFDDPIWEASPSLGSEWSVRWGVGGVHGSLGGRGNLDPYVKLDCCNLNNKVKIKMEYRYKQRILNRGIPNSREALK